MNSKELARDCTRIIVKRMSHEIDDDQFYLDIMELHQKYPMNGHSPPLTKERILNRHKSIIYPDEHYVDDLQPKNFKEAADMFMFCKRAKTVPKSYPIPKVIPIDVKKRSAGDENGSY